MNWSIFDFAFFGAMILGVIVVYALAKRRANNRTYRFAIGVALAAAFLLVWINGAVGIIGNENNDANMMFFGVLLVGVIGAIIARLRPKGLARAMYAFGSRDQISGPRKRGRTSRALAASQMIPYRLRPNILSIKLCAIAQNIDVRTNTNVTKL